MDNLDADVQHCNALVTGRVTCLANAPQGDNIVVSGEKTAAAQVFSLHTGTCIGKPLQHSTDHETVSFSFDVLESKKLLVVL